MPHGEFVTVLDADPALAIAAATAPRRGIPHAINAPDKGGGLPMIRTD